MFLKGQKSKLPCIFMSTKGRNRYLPTVTCMTCLNILPQTLIAIETFLFLYNLIIHNNRKQPCKYWNIHVFMQFDWQFCNCGKLL